ncbi:MAG: hypothetical protein MZW92_63020 [Comamonadaceae bacterium]|nr:hypothetical protein [Comamonadaceae bacterium]
MLLYAVDPRDPAKQQAAQALAALVLAARLRTRQHAGDARVLRQPAAVRRRCRSRTLAPRPRVPRVAPSVVDDETVDAAWSLQDRFGFAYWDALMVAAAQQLGCVAAADRGLAARPAGRWPSHLEPFQRRARRARRRRGEPRLERPHPLARSART